MKKVLVLALLITTTISLFAVEFSGDFRTRFTLYQWFGKDVDSESFIDSRAQIQLKANPSEDFYVTYMIKAGDYIWGDDEGTGMFSNKVNVKTKHLFAEYHGFENTSVKLGLLPWYDQKSLVLDDDIAGIFVNHRMMEDLNIEVGYSVLYNSMTNNDDYDYGDADQSLFFLSVDKSEMFGFNTIISTYKEIGDSGKESSMMDLWFMPYFRYNFSGLNIDAMFAYTHGSYEKWASNGKDVTNSGYAFALDVEYDTNGFGIPGLNILFASGDDGEDEESTSAFYTLSAYYMNGLELLGAGVHDSSPKDFWFDPFNKGDGFLSVVARYAYPVSEKLTARMALGMVSSIESVNAEIKDKTDMGTEINIGFDYKLSDNVALHFIGAYAMPGEYFGKDLDDAYEISSVLNVKF